MRSVKLFIFLVLLFISIGFATVSISLSLSGNAKIASDISDFLVYYSDVKVDNVQDLSLVKNKTELVFNLDLDRIGTSRVISYDVTNASTKFDANLSIACTSSNDYLKVVNIFDLSVLPALSTRTGTLTLTKIKTNSSYYDNVYDISCNIVASPVERFSIDSGEVVEPLPSYKYLVGTEISIGEEKFNVISSTDTTVTMLAQYNLSTSYRQSTTSNDVAFAEHGSESMSYNDKYEIDIQVSSTNPKNYVNAYVSYLRTFLGSSLVSGDLITLSQLRDLGCTVVYNYSGSLDTTCINSPYTSWLYNNQSWWTRTAFSSSMIVIFYIDSDLDTDKFIDSSLVFYWSPGGIRPVITLPKELLEREYIEFTIDGETYRALEGMTWEEWVNSPFNTGGYEIIDNVLSINYGDEDYDHIEVVYNCDGYETAMGTDIIVPNGVYEESSGQPEF